MDGLPVWFSEDHEGVVNERFDMVFAENGRPGKLMRFCHRCEVPLGIMSREEYDLKYVSGGNACSACGRVAYEEPLLR